MTPSFHGLRFPKLVLPVAPIEARGSLRTTLIGVAVAGGYLIGAVTINYTAFGLHLIGGDAFAYWKVGAGQLYVPPLTGLGAFLYPPPLAALFSLANLVSWPTFWTLWFAVLVATVLWLGGSGWLYLLAFPPVVIELCYGNINLLIAAAVTLGFRFPALWSVVVLTKVTPGVGLIWFLVRREWWSFFVALGTTAGIVLFSLLADTDNWVRWFAALPAMGAANGVPLSTLSVPRIAIAAGIVAWGAKTDRPWLVPVGCCLAMPVIWPASLSVLSAVPAIRRRPLTPPRGAQLR